MNGLVWSYLPLFQYDATLFRGVNSQKSKEEIMKFDLKLVLSFRTMGVFFPAISISCTRVCVFENSQFILHVGLPINKNTLILQIY